MIRLRTAGASAMIAAAVLLASAWMAGAQQAAAPKTTGFDLKKPVVGAACPMCPWGAMAILVKEAMSHYGWDILICYYCAGGPREARLVSKAAMATPPQNPGPDTLPTPNGPIDFGVTGTEFLQWAYLGTNDFAKDPGTPQRQLRLIAKIQEPTYYIIAVKADSRITNLTQIVENRMPVKMVARTGIGGETTPVVLEYYGITEEKIESFGGTYATSYDREKETDVFIGFGSLTNAPEYALFHQASQRYDLRYLELAPDLKQRLIRQFHYKEGVMPVGTFRGVDKPIPTLVRDGTVIYGRTDTPDEFAYTLAKALDEHQELLQWPNASMNWSYNWRTVWKALDIPLHPGAEKYYKEVGYMK